jgi:hypothetical protein
MPPGLTVFGGELLVMMKLLNWSLEDSSAQR